MKSRLILAMVLTCVVAASAAAGTIDEVKMTVDVILDHQDDLVFDALGLSDEQYKAFQPIYLEYRMAMDQAGANKISLIKSFMENQGKLDEAKAAEMINQFFAAKESGTKIRKYYADKALTVLPATKVMRFIQIENKITALVDLKLAEAIPLTK